MLYVTQRSKILFIDYSRKGLFIYLYVIYLFAREQSERGREHELGGGTE